MNPPTPNVATTAAAAGCVIPAPLTLSALAENVKPQVPHKAPNPAMLTSTKFRVAQQRDDPRRLGFLFRMARRIAKEGETEQARANRSCAQSDVGASPAQDVRKWQRKRICYHNAQ